MFKLAWFSDSINLPTGYAQVTRNLLYRFKLAGIDVNAIGFQTSFGAPAPSDIPINYGFRYPQYLSGTGPGQEWYGNRGTIETAIKDIKPKFACFLCDSFMIKWMFEKKGYDTEEYRISDWGKIVARPIDIMREKYKPKFLFYFPFDSDEVYEGADNVMKDIDTRVAMSKFGQRVLKRDTGLDSVLIPHGVDTMVYRPLPQQIRENLKKANKWEDKFVIGCVTRNQSRKMLPVLYEAYKILLDQGYNDLQLFMHCDPKDGMGWPLRDLEKKIGIEGKVVYGMKSHREGRKEPEMNLAYNCMDLHVHPTTGEGFGLTTIESMACGIPNLITDCTTSRELIREHGELIKRTGNIPQDSWVRGQLNTRRSLPSVEDTVKKIEKLYKDKELRDKYSKAGREFVVKWFDWSKIVRAWLELFEYGEIYERFDY